MVVKIEGEKIPKVGSLLRVKKDFSKFIADSSEYDFRVSGVGSTWTETREWCEVDKDSCEDGQRVVQREKIVCCYAYGNLI
jgi:hypothetical protein